MTLDKLLFLFREGSDSAELAPDSLCRTSASEELHHTEQIKQETCKIVSDTGELAAAIPEKASPPHSLLKA